MSEDDKDLTTVQKLFSDMVKRGEFDGLKDKEFKVGKKTFVRKWGKLPYEKATCNTGYQCYASYKYSGGFLGSLSECKNCKRVYVLTDNGWEVSNFTQRHALGWSSFVCGVLAFGLVALIYTVFGLWWF